MHPAAKSEISPPNPAPMEEKNPPNEQTAAANDPEQAAVKTDNRPASLRENPGKRDYHTQERIELLMAVARDTKKYDVAKRLRALEMVEELRRDVRKMYAQRLERAAQRSETDEPEPSNQSMTDEQKGVLGF